MGGRCRPGPARLPRPRGAGAGSTGGGRSKAPHGAAVGPDRVGGSGGPARADDCLTPSGRLAASSCQHVATAATHLASATSRQPPPACAASSAAPGRGWTARMRGPGEEAVAVGHLVAVCLFDRVTPRHGTPLTTRRARWYTGMWLPEWRNWQTHRTQNPADSPSVRVRLPLPAPLLRRSPAARRVYHPPRERGAWCLCQPCDAWPGGRLVRCRGYEGGTSLCWLS